MSDDPEAKLFYGYLQPTADKERYAEMTEESSDAETPWSNIHVKKAHGCVGGMYGYEDNLGFFLAVEEALHEVSWDKTKRIGQHEFLRPEAWDKQLLDAANFFNLDVSALEPGWYLVSLYY